MVAEVKPFTKIAAVYDDLTVDVPYELWIEFLLRAAKERGLNGKQVLELGCGTGNATVLMHSRGFNVTGLDSSEDMLHFARAKLPFIRFARGYFESFVLKKRFSLVYSVFDSINNLLDVVAFRNMAQRVYVHLEPGGIFGFDMNTTIGLRELWVDNRIEGSVRDIVYRFEHSFDEEKRLARVDVLWETRGEKYSEVHYERGYEIVEVRKLLEAAGFNHVEVLEYPSGKPAAVDAPRVWVVAKKSV